MAIEYRTCLYCGKAWRTGTMDPNRYCSTGCWADALAEDLETASPAQDEQADDEKA